MKIIDLFPFRQLNEHAFIKHSYLFLNEAIYDTKITSLKKKFPDSEPDIDAQLSWAKSIFKTPGQINWWINLFGDYLENKLSTKQLGDYQFKSIEQLKTDISHYFGYKYEPIRTFVFDNKTVKQILTDLSNLENQFKQKQETDTPVPIQEGDYKLYEFPDGTAWWYVNRAYCSDEAKSGKHCGNVVGKYKPNQRILSLRTKAGNVILTFIYEPDRTLGEMKAKGNQKPAEKYHQHIYTLLMGNKLPIKGITGMGYLPEMNFSVFDFNEETLKDIFTKKRALISTQLYVTPVELLKAPSWIRQNTTFKQIAFEKLPGLRSLLDIYGNVETNENAWEKAINENEKLILYAPPTIDEYYERMRDYLEFNPADLLRVPVALRKNFDFLCDLIKDNNEIVGYIVPTTPRYHDLMEFAIKLNGRSIQYIPEELRDEHLCSLAISKSGLALQYVPVNLRTSKLCIDAVINTKDALHYVPASALSEELFLEVINHHKNYELRQVPNEYRTKKICMAALAKNGKDLPFVPEKLIDEELYLTAVSQNGGVLYYIPENLRTEKVCLAAVTQDGLVLRQVPDELKTEKICHAAVSNEGLALKFVPKDLRTEKICLIAVTHEGYALKYVPYEMKTEEICLIAVRNDRSVLDLYVPEEMIDLIQSQINQVT